MENIKIGKVESTRDDKIDGRRRKAIISIRRTGQK